MEATRRKVVYFQLSNGREPAREWLEQLKDTRGRKRIFTRIDRAELGNFGDHRSVGDGVSEMRVDSGPGYRVYYAIGENDEIIVLLMAGDKSTQPSDIAEAKEYWKAYKGN